MWIWDPLLGQSGWKEIKSTAGALPVAGFVNLVQNSTNFFVIGGQDMDNTNGIPLSQPYTAQVNYSSGTANWVGTTPSLPSPQRFTQSVVATRNFTRTGEIVYFVYFSGEVNATRSLNDVWSAVAETELVTAR